MNVDDRGSFTAVENSKLRTVFCEYLSQKENIDNSKSGILHCSVWTWIDSGAKDEDLYEAIEFEVSGNSRLRQSIVLPGYTHNIINLSETENLVNMRTEQFDPNHPDTFFERVKVRRD